MNHVLNKTAPFFRTRISAQKLRSVVLLALAITGCSAHSAWAVQFNTDIIDTKDRGNLDLSRFEVAGYVPPGEYLLELSVNGHFLPGQQLIKFIAPTADQPARACLPLEMVKGFGLSDDATRALTTWHKGDCVSFDNAPDVRIHFDPSQQRLSLSFPQAWMRYRNRDWVGPEAWDHGISGVMLDYNILGGRYDPAQGEHTDSLSSYGTVGVNLGAWRLRGDYQYAYSHTPGSPETHRFDWNQVYAFRPLPSIGARLTVGQTYLRSDIFDSFRFAGAALTSDQRMLPPTLRGYAPQVTGVAQTNARVVITQRGRVLYQTKVTPGPFVIQDLSDVITGLLDVRVEEEDGRVNIFQVNAASVPFLTRKGTVRYKVASGKPTLGIDNHALSPLFYTGEMTYGLFNNTSLYGGAIWTDKNDYSALALGIGQNLLSFGAISFDVTRSDAELPQYERQSAYSYRFNYSKRFDSTNTQVTFAGYRFSERNFLSMSQFIDKHNQLFDMRNDKQTFTLTANQYLPWPDITLYASAVRHTYWDDKNSNTYTLSLSKTFDLGPFQGASATLYGGKATYGDEQGNQVSLSLTLPISNGQQVSYDSSRDDQSGYLQTLSYYNSTDPDNTWRLSAGGSASQLNSGEGVFRAGYNHSAAAGQLSIDGSHSENRYRSISANWYGSLTMTPKGAAFHQSSIGSEPRLMLDTDGVPGVSFNGGAARTNRAGIAVLGSAPSYQTTDARVDMGRLPDDTEVYTSMLQDTLTEGAIGYRKVRAVRGEHYLAEVHREDGSPIPMGSSLTNRHNGMEMGIVGDGGMVYLTGINEGDLLSVFWNDREQCRIRIMGSHTVQDGTASETCYAVSGDNSTVGK